MITWAGMALTLEVAYADAAALADDAATQLARGGLYVAVDATGLPPLAELTLRLILDGEAMEAAARVTVATADAVCVELLPEGREQLLTAVAARVGGAAPRPGQRQARIHDASAPQAHGATAQLHDAAAPHGHGAVAQLDDAAAPRLHDASASVDAELTLERKIAVMSVGEKIQLALHGNRDARALLMRDRAGVVQSSLVRNPKVSLDEVQALARSPQLAADCADTLAQHPVYGTSPQVALALVRNPRTPVPVAAALVGKLLPSDLRVVAKGLGVRTQVAAAARKRLLDPPR